jgi:predicted PurR-regulated permease PerM
VERTPTPLVRGLRLDDASLRLLAKCVGAVLVLLLLVGTAVQLSPILLQTCVAVFAAISLDTVVRSLQRHGIGRGWAITIVLLAAAFGAAAIVVALLQPLIDGCAALSEAAPDIVESFEGSSTWAWLQDNVGVKEDVLETLRSTVVAIPGAVAHALMSLVGDIFGLVSMVLMVIFLLTGGGSIVRLLVRLWPRFGSASGWTVVSGAYANIGRYIVGATAQATLAGISLALVLAILGVPYALPLGLLMFLLDFVPLVGATIGSIPAVAVALFAEGIGDALVVTAFLIVYQQIENALIQPRIQGKVVQMPAIAIFFSVTIGGELLGIVGALFAVPVASVIAIMLRQWLEYSGRAEVEPPPLFDERGRPVA